MGVFGKRLQLGGCAERSGPLFRLVSRLDLLEKAEAEVDAGGRQVGADKAVRLAQQVGRAEEERRQVLGLRVGARVGRQHVEQERNEPARLLKVARAGADRLDTVALATVLLVAALIQQAAGVRPDVALFQRAEQQVGCLDQLFVLLLACRLIRPARQVQGTVETHPIRSLIL